MNALDVNTAISEELRSVWRIRAALAFLRGTRDARLQKDVPLRFMNVPKASGVDLFPSSETVKEALDASERYEATRMASDTFLVLLVPIERFLSARLAAAGLKAEGTLGYLQKAAEGQCGLAAPDIVLMDEVRERRNCLVHHHSVATQRYVDAANVAAPHSGGEVKATTIGTRVAITWAYLGYAAEVLIRYAKAFP